MRVIARESVGWSIGWSVALIVLGLAALLLPLVVGVAISVVLGVLLVLGGLVHFGFAWHTRGAGAAAWQVLVGLVYVIGGLYMLVYPVAGVLTLTLVIAIYLLIKGITEFVLAARLRPVPGSGWMFVDGVVSVVLALLIWTHLAGTAPWLLGTLVGIAILFSGVSRMMLAMTARRLGVAV
jgi:uncharacterized membrane protein HdeD (DUF308 family)